MPLLLETSQHVPKAIKLTGTAARLNAHLDGTSVVAVAYLQAWGLLHLGRKVPAAGGVRRALAFYVRHLQSLQGEPAASEARAIRTACTALKRPAEDLDEALQRLADVPPGADLPSFAEINTGQEGASMVARVNAAWEALDALRPPSRATPTPRTKTPCPQTTESK